MRRVWRQGLTVPAVRVLPPQITRTLPRWLPRDASTRFRRHLPIAVLSLIRRPRGVMQLGRFCGSRSGHPTLKSANAVPPGPERMPLPSSALPPWPARRRSADLGRTVRGRSHRSHGVKFGTTVFASMSGGKPWEFQRNNWIRLTVPRVCIICNSRAGSNHLKLPGLRNGRTPGGSCSTPH